MKVTFNHKSEVVIPVLNDGERHRFTLKPGDNDVDSQAWEKAKQNKVVQQWIARDVIKVSNAGRPPKEKKESTPGRQSSTGETAGNQGQ